MANKESGVETISRFTRRTLIVIGLASLVAVLLFFAGQLIDVMLLVFASILVAVAIDGAVRLCQRHLPLSRPWALLLALLMICLSLVGLGALIGPRIGEQLPQLVAELPQAFLQLLNNFRELPGIETAMAEVEEPAQLIGEPVIDYFTNFFSTTFGAIASFFLILLIGFYLVLSPAKYIGNVLLMCPPAKRDRVAQVLCMQGRALRLWLLSRLVSMVFVGVSVALGLVLLGVPMAGALGLVAGLFTFIPYLGPIIGAIPTILIAFLESPQLALYALILYLVVETLESNLVMPLAAKGLVRLPPAYTVIVQLAGAAVAGVAGVILSTPLAVVAVVTLQALYINDVLGDDIEVLGGR
ncbi:AI-2E family transporter [Billgrantia desiderata]|uniref:AI-2E family transporter n=1 Tax=Billgrantia desiderata TaxID=52021 RepID=A0AAW4YNH8_9GAMM|nr:AI-2E family transporter [Halomonas desiderata]MCE8011863.1 AI-2E family transporter [Halomonas desiderata]MCE8028576.1 AI-2E family transporter [Halomonas desiderata]MCE8044236.1 AI-2E family transporter [Halomonas desiderata]MCE8048810.1 AI-2E family transporter [Halomonas desiderata]MCE8049999.1 AI-2E family transporter [Halomonas desiderata]